MPIISIRCFPFFVDSLHFFHSYISTYAVSLPLSLYPTAPLSQKLYIHLTPSLALNYPFSMTLSVSFHLMSSIPPSVILHSPLLHFSQPFPSSSVPWSLFLSSLCHSLIHLPCHFPTFSISPAVHIVALRSSQLDMSTLQWCGGKFHHSGRGSAAHTGSHDCQRDSVHHSCSSRERKKTEMKKNCTMKVLTLVIVL